MHRLGYKRYVAQGGDWGSVVTTEMARQQLPDLAAVHINLPFVVPAKLPRRCTDLLGVSVVEKQLEIIGEQDDRSGFLYAHERTCA